MGNDPDGEGWDWGRDQGHPRYRRAGLGLIIDGMTTYSSNQFTTGAHERVLRRCPHRRIVGGVAAGVADYLDVDVAAVRIGFAALTLLAGVGVPLYIAAWLLLPEEGSDLSIGEELADRVGLR